MNPFLPDWMFAAFAIGSWTLASWIYRHWHFAPARWIAGGVIFICLVVLLTRYIARYVYRRKHPQVEDPDDWKEY